MPKTQFLFPSIGSERKTFWQFYNRKQIFDKSLILYEGAASEDPGRAAPADDSCLVYVYNRNQICFSPMYIAFDSEASHIGIGTEDFVLRALPSDNHELRAGISGDLLLAYSVDWSESHTVFACIAGETLFFELDIKQKQDSSSGWFGQKQDVVVAKILPIAASSARSYIAERKLILGE